jgi:nitrite reductase/ring-hydroxylating ferredoxin subunit/uncharacterized membrane protein
MGGEGARPTEYRVGELGQRATAAVGRQKWLDRPSYRFEHILTITFAAFGGARERVSNALHGTWLGHPVHPVLTSLPTGAVATAVALDGASALPGSAPSLRDASRHALGVGIVGSVGAAVTGLTDWQHTHEQSRRIGLVHGALNGIATALYVMSWWDRRRGRHLRGVVGSTLGYGITLGSGYLGGELVYGSATGVDQSGERLAVTDWTPVLAVSGLSNATPTRVEVDDVGVVLHRNGADILAIGEYCPHRGAPMSDGWIDRDRIVCPWHGSRFSAASGEVLRGPATAPLHCYPTRVHDGMIEVGPVALGTRKEVAG